MTTAQLRGIPLSKVVANGGNPLQDRENDQDPLDGQLNTQLYRWTGGGTPPTRLDLPCLSNLERIAGIAVSDTHVLCLTSLGIVYSYGSNFDGQLGHPTISSARRFRPIEKFLENGNTITQISAGSLRGIGSHSAAIDMNGRLFMWGRSTLCGGSPSSDSSPSPTVDPPKVVESLKNHPVLQVSCGGAFTLARAVSLDSQGRQSTNVYSWGLLDSGRVGIGRVDGESDAGRGRKKKVPLYQLCPARIETLDAEDICHVSAGTSHGLAVSASGKTYAWGSNADGQCCVAGDIDKSCTGMLDDVWSPQAVHPFGSSSGPKARSASAGRSTSAVIDADGRLWTWGGGGDSKALLLGHGEGTDPEEYAVPVTSRRGNEDSLPVSGRSMAEIALLSGCDKIPPFCIPRAVEALQDSVVTKADMSGSFGSAISESKELYAWGSHQNNMSDKTAIPTPALQSMSFVSVTEVASSSAMGLFFVTEGSAIATSLGTTLLGQCSQLKLVDCCIITATGKRLGCHSSILACRSTVLKEMVKDRSNKDGTTVELLLPGVQEETAQALLEYLYTGGISASQVCSSVPTLRLLEAAKKFQLPGLVTICRRCLLEDENLGMSVPGSLEDTKEQPSTTTIVRDFGSMLEDPIGSDVSIIARGGEIISAHWSVLTARSRFFSETYSSMASTPRETIECTLQISEPHGTIVRLLHYIYKSELVGQGNDELVQDLLCFHKYGVHSAKPFIASSLTITGQNASEMFDLAKQTTTSLLKEKSLQALSRSPHEPGTLPAETANALATWVRDRRFLSTIPREHLKETMNEMERARQEEAKRIEEIEMNLMGVGEGMPLPLLLALAAATATVYVSLQHLEDGGPVIFIANALFVGLGVRYGHKALL